MNNTDIFTELTDRGLVAQSSDPAAITSLLSQPTFVYCGFDPTAGSLHIGHLVPLLMLARLQKAGHTAIALIGGATGLIGDPSFKATERTLNSDDIVNTWANKLSEQIQTIMQSLHDGESQLQIVNNADWIRNLNTIDFLRDVGKHFSVNAMLNRESVKQRLNRHDQGISFTEFSYSLLQSFDFAKLNQIHRCRLQIGGNDQWGNIVSGIDLTRRLNNETVYGLTLPLIKKSDGTKFGKTESGTVWLDSEKTSPYAFYQFWLNTADADVYNFLRFYTFLSEQEIQHIEHEDKSSQGKPVAQRILAEQVTELVHGKEQLLSAQRITDALFSNDIQRLSLEDLKQLELDGIPCSPVSEIMTLTQALVATKLATSNRQAREFIGNKAIQINGKVCNKEDIDEDINNEPALHQRYWLLKRGKKHFHLLKMAA
ncbi:tyrosine--tRNA ligase [Vibrio sp. Of7-15]|uniref:tyrosine--tRNA ligase n=1 Tax=Vibrio sp. Of7-15 TaxID=2724879 RepID=UPI001EF224C4|nr:tyrosine--tRNA ligase [Vibrio sp. Of7-15]MCG7497321.1 tyrosine--tRNA ligase [Vibrio sp. Of7-15]